MCTYVTSMTMMLTKSENCTALAVDGAVCEQRARDVLLWFSKMQKGERV